MQQQIPFRLAVDWMGNGLLNTMKQHREKYCMKPSNAQSGSALCSIKKKKLINICTSPMD